MDENPAIIQSPLADKEVDNQLRLWIARGPDPLPTLLSVEVSTIVQKRRPDGKKNQTMIGRLSQKRRKVL